MIEKYYEDELRYLYDSGKEFARAHPDRARFLNIDAVGDRDPYVERLFEGFAFLAARIREKLDDAFPELTEGLINLMWPQFLQEIPSCAIVQLRPRPGLLNETRTLARGSEIITGPVGPESVSCRFITTQDVKLSPIALRSAVKTIDNRGNAVLKLRFELDGKAAWQDLALSPLRLYLHAERPTAQMLREYLCSKVIKASIDVNDNQLSVACDPGTVCSPAGYTAAESLLPHDQRAFSSSAILLEYFTYPEKFLFVDLAGSANVPFCDPQPRSLTWTLTFNGDFPPDEQFSADSFRLFCTPAVNLFKSDIEPIRHEGRKHEYRLIADAGHLASVGVHSILSVTGIDRITGKRIEYEPINAFKSAGMKNGSTFAARRSRSPDGKRQVMMQIGGEGLDGGEIREQNLTVEAWCTNGDIAREEITENGINRGGRDFPDYVMVTNITRPTLPCHPPETDDFQWVFLSHQGSNYMSLADAAALKAFLRLYSWSGEEGNSMRINAITTVSASPAEKNIAGSAIRGVKFEVAVVSSNFSGSGDIYLFGETLKEFLSQYVSINSFLELALVLKPSGQTISYSSLQGKQWLI